jgi:hypothetical protein
MSRLRSRPKPTSLPKSDEGGNFPDHGGQCEDHSAEGAYGGCVSDGDRTGCNDALV